MLEAEVVGWGQCWPMYACQRLVGGILFCNPRDHWLEESADHEDSPSPFCMDRKTLHFMHWNWATCASSHEFPFLFPQLENRGAQLVEKKTAYYITHSGLSPRRTLSRFAGQSLCQGSVWPLPVMKSSETEILWGELTSHVTYRWAELLLSLGVCVCGLDFVPFWLLTADYPVLSLRWGFSQHL